MFRAARQAYMEYEHSHNPCTVRGNFDYAFRRGGCAFYVLDGRGHRNIGRKCYRILGQQQFDRFARWIKDLTPEKTPFLFVVSAVPVLPPRATPLNAFVQRVLNWTRLGDDLRDSWLYCRHTDERKALMKKLFSAAKRGIRVAILSGDAHVSAAFVLKDKKNHPIYQLTSSAITNKAPRVWAWLLRCLAPDNGEIEGGYRFKRLALCTENSYALIRVDPPKEKAWFKLYSKQRRKASSEGTDTKAVPMSYEG